MMMPAMGGASLIKALRSIDPEVRILATSGLADEAKRAEVEALGLPRILAKPCPPAELLEAVQKALN
jgi:DNA-binding NarL/FixJ family response regulator